VKKQRIIKKRFDLLANDCNFDEIGVNNTDVLTLTDDQKAQLKALADKLILLAQ
jgi:hypothetical protein